MTYLKPCQDTPVAYFCAEYGLSAHLPIYAGGLGILAGDTLKAAVDADTPVVAVGLLYRGYYQVQVLDETGYQQEHTYEYDPVTAGLEHVYLDDLPLFVQVHLTAEEEVWVRCWKKTLSNNVVLYLLDTDTDQNEPRERSITHALYTGSEESQLLQQIILGVGGVKLLQKLGIQPCVFHANEGRPAFLHWQLIRMFMDEHGFSFDQAHQEAKTRTVYTNHTLVGAGNPGMSVQLLQQFAQYQAEQMKVPVTNLLEFGVEDNPDRFQTTRFALNTSRKASGVSQLHYRLSKQNWPEYNWVGITNGVHLGTWQDQTLKHLMSQMMPAEQETSEDSMWQVWNRHLQLKRQTMEFIQARTGYGYDPNRLIMSWARRITGYKQLPSLFADLERLRTILRGTNSGQEVQLLVAGKAHPGDSVGKETLQEIIKHFSQELAGFALFVPNYDMDVGRALVTGSDVWLNTPEFGKEASGTSGMKAISNGVLNCTVADGWAAEVNWQGLGWTLDHTNLSDSLYRTLEQDVVPTFQFRTEAGLPIEWLGRMKRSVQLAEQFSAGRMWQQYVDLLYQ